jgi:hypothetical protein
LTAIYHISRKLSIIFLCGPGFKLNSQFPAITSFSGSVALAASRYLAGAQKRQRPFSATLKKSNGNGTKG